MRYRYCGAEVQLAEFQVYLREVTIKVLDLSSFRAEGSITFCDYTEHGIVATDPWVAESTDGGATWVVNRAPLKEGEFAFHLDSDHGQPSFTLVVEINVEIKAFVAAKIAYVTSQDQSDPTSFIEEAITPYAGPIFAYSGPCVCESVRQSSDADPFDWNAHTDGGKFPDRCFGCSCGNRWYLADPDEFDWVPVFDDETWQMFMKNNGLAYRTVRFDPRHQGNPPPLILLEELCKAGLTPM